MWSRLLGMLLVFFSVVAIARAQSPPSSFYDGRSNEELRALASDPTGDVLLRRGAATRLVMTLADEGEFDAADAAAREFAKNIDPRARQHLRAARRRSRAHSAAVVALASALAMAMASVVAARRSFAPAAEAVRRIAPVVTLFLLYVGLLGGVLASSYENSSSVPFVLFAALMLPMMLLFRMWSAVGSPRIAARFGRGAIAVAATVALGFLVVETINPSYLEGIGL